MGCVSSALTSLFRYYFHDINRLLRRRTKGILAFAVFALAVSTTFGDAICVAGVLLPFFACWL